MTLLCELERDGDGGDKAISMGTGWALLLPLPFLSRYLMLQLGLWLVKRPSAVFFLLPSTTRVLAVLALAYCLLSRAVSRLN